MKNCCISRSQYYLSEKKFIKELCDSIKDPVLNARVKNLLGYAYTRAVFSKYAFLFCTIAAIVISSAIFVLNTIGQSDFIRTSITVFSALSAVITSIAGVLQWKINWPNYRKSAERMKHEAVMYLKRCGDYVGKGDIDCDLLFLTRIEGIASDENIKWNESHAKDDTHSSDNNMPRDPLNGERLAE